MLAVGSMKGVNPSPAVRTGNGFMKLRHFSLPILLILIGVYMPVLAQDSDTTTREELLKDRRLAKKESLSTPQHSAVERMLLRIERVGIEQFLDVSYGGIYPQVGTISNGSGLGLGFSYGQRDLGNTSLALHTSGMISYRNYQQARLQFGTVPGQGNTADRSIFYSDHLKSNLAPEDSPGDHHFNLFGEIRYHRLPQMDFFGLGPDSLSFQRGDFLLRDTSYDLIGSYRWNDHLGAGLRGGLLDVTIGRGTEENYTDIQDMFDSSQLPGLEASKFGHVTASTWLDYRDHATDPHLGGVLFISASHFSDRDLARFSFSRLQFDARHYVSLGSVQRTLAVRLFASADQANSGHRVPFFMQETLGGSDSLRGYPAFRFRDENLVYLSSEYRWEPAPAVQLVLFYDTGKVFPSWSDLELDGLKKSIGWGIRFKTPHKMFLRIEVARSEEGTQFHFKIGPAF